MTISIVVPNYNNSKYIKQCINSVLSQSVREIEIIIVDDASTDDSKIICNDLIKNDPRIKLIEMKYNRGVSAARNLGAIEATGDYITFLDSDDYYINDNKLIKELNVISRAKAKLNSKDVCAYSAVNVVDEAGGLLYSTKPMHYSEEVWDQIVLRGCDIPRDLLIPRKVFFESGGFDTALNLFEDWDLKIRLSRICAFIPTNISGSAYRQRNGGLSDKSRCKIFFQIIRVFIKNTYEIKMHRRIYMLTLVTLNSLIRNTGNRY